MNPFIHIHPDTFTKDRNNGIGASDIPILCGASDWCSPYELWKQKRGDGENEIDEKLQQLFDAGHYQEPITMHRYLKKDYPDIANSVIIRHAEKGHFSKTAHAQINTRFYHPEHKFMFCHPDLIFNDTNIEVKYSRYSSDFDFDDLTEEGIPFKYYLQVQYQMLCTGLKTSYLVLNYCGLEHYEYGPIPANKDLHSKMEKICFDFWQLVQNNEPPLPTTRSDVKDLFPNKKFLAKTIPEDLEILTILQKDRFNILKKRRAKDEKEQKKIKAIVTALMVDNNVLNTQTGETICKISVSTKDDFVKGIMQLLEDDHPELLKLLKKKELIKEKTTERVYL